MIELELLTHLRRLLSEASAVAAQLSGDAPINSVIGERNFTHFRSSGHLSDAGVEAVYALFDKGCSIEKVANAIGISIRGAAGRRQAWLAAKLPS